MSTRTIADRVADARAALENYGGPDAEICDLLADLMHLLDFNGLDITDELERARRNHYAEVEEARAEEARQEAERVLTLILDEHGVGFVTDRCIARDASIVRDRLSK